ACAKQGLRSAMPWSDGERADARAGGAADPVRIAKWTAIIVGSLLLLLVISAYVMTSLIDPNRYRGKVEAIVADLVGRPFVIEGNIELTWYPWLGIRTG